METKDTPQGIVGLRFARALLAGGYTTAQALLSPELKLEYPVPLLRQRFQEMMSLANYLGELPDIQVMDNSSLGNLSLDVKGWAYVAIWMKQ